MLASVMEVFQKDQVEEDPPENKEKINANKKENCYFYFFYLHHFQQDDQ